MSSPSLVHIVDDERAVADALQFLLASRGVASRTYVSGEAFLANYRPSESHESECALLDMRMPGMSGLQVQAALLERFCDLPIIFLTGHADVPRAVQALKSGAFDFIEKPFSDNDLVDRVIAALSHHSSTRDRAAGGLAIRERVATLTPREREVMAAVVAGKLNKMIAEELGVSMRTVEVHRSRIFEKMGVRGAVELTSLLSQVNSRA